MLSRIGARLAAARVVNRPAVFLLREHVLPSGSPAVYRLRADGPSLVVRHRTADVETLREIFLACAYDPPSRDVQLAFAQLRGSVIADLGANIGLFGVWALDRLFPERIVAYEPDPANLGVLRRCSALNAERASWEIVDALAGSADGTARLLATGTPGARVATDQDVARTVAVRRLDVFPRLGHVALVKLDIEGGEWELLADPRLARLPAKIVIVEHHPFLCPRRSPRQHCRELLERAGYRVTPGVDWGDGTGVLWGVREAGNRAPGLPPPEAAAGV